MFDKLKKLTWKKLAAAIVNALVVILADELGLSQEDSLQITAGFVAYIVGQGIADNGKEAAKIQAPKE